MLIRYDELWASEAPKIHGTESIPIALGEIAHC